jgi:pyruvate dehydrogenase E1 component beta subunit
MREEMSRDETVVLIGEDMRAPMWAGAGLAEMFGARRVLNAPISEAGFIGAAIGAAALGLRPVVDMTIATLLYCGMDQIVNNAAKMRYMSGGQVTLPIVYRAMMQYGRSSAAHHADRPYSMFMSVPGLIVCAPATPYDAMGLLKSAIRDDNPVLFFEDASVASARELLPDEEYLVPLGRAKVTRPGEDITLVGIAGGAARALEAAQILASDHGISAEVIDPRTLVPLDRETILGSASRTGRLVLVDPAPRNCSAASEIAATAAEEIFGRLAAPIALVTAPNVPVPFAPALEQALYPTTKNVVDAAVRTLAYRE